MTRRSNPISPEIMRWLNEQDQTLGMGKPRYPLAWGGVCMSAGEIPDTACDDKGT
jgi:hypothetical protein